MGGGHGNPRGAKEGAIAAFRHPSPLTLSRQAAARIQAARKGQQTRREVKKVMQSALDRLGYGAKKVMTEYLQRCAFSPEAAEALAVEVFG